MSEESKSSMTRERSIFLEALKLSTPEERAAFLDRECGSDANFRAAIESLLKHHKDDNFMAKPGGTVRLSPVTEKPGDRIGRYKLMEQIGEGGFGVVYVAEQREPVRRMVALKISKLGMDTRQVVARFEAERQALAMMDHPNIAKVLDGGATDSGRPYFVMELVRGIRVTDYCDQKKLTTRQRLDLFMQICRAVQHAHQKGVIHRDIKPSNILVTLHDGVPVPKVIDFGIAKATQGHLTDKTIYTEFQQFMGTPAYMSPEQAEMSGLDIDTRSDLYSLGVLLYELLTGSPPFEEKALLECGLDEMRRTICEKEPPRPSTRLGDLTPDDLTTTARRHGTEPPKLLNLVRGDLDWIVMKCLEKDRSRRYESASGVAADIERHLNNEPIVARPPSSAYRFQKMVRRNKAAFAAGMAVVASLLIVLIVSSWSLVKERRAHQLATESDIKAQIEARRADQNATSERDQRLRADKALETSRTLFALSIHSDKNVDVALAYLTKVLSMRPTNRVAISRLAALLVYNANFMTTNLTNFIGDFTDEFNLSFSPNGNRIVTTLWRFWPNAIAENTHLLTTNCSAHMWDAQTGQPLGLPPAGVENSDLKFTPDGDRIFSISTNGVARLWDSLTCQPMSSPMTNGEGAEERFSPNHQLILITSTNGPGHLWDAHTGQQMGPPIPRTDRIWPIFSPDGSRMLKISSNSIACLFDSMTGQPLTPQMINTEVTDAAFSRDGKRLVMNSTNGTIRVWDVGTGQPIGFPIHCEDKNASFLVSSNGDRILTISDTDFIDQRVLHLWNSLTGKSISSQLSRVGGEPRFSPDGKLVLTRSGDRKVHQVWDALSGKPLSEPMTNNLDRTWGDILFFTPDSKRLLALSDVMRLWDAKTLKSLIQPTTISNLFGSVQSPEFSSDGRLVSFITYKYSYDHKSSASIYWLGDNRPGIDWHAVVLNTTNGRIVKEMDGSDGRPEFIVGDMRFDDDLDEPRCLLITSNGWPAQVCELHPTGSQCRDWVLKLAEAVSGLVLNDQGLLEKTKLDRVQTINDIRAKLNKDSSDDDWTVWGRWLLADPSTRCLSPFYARNRREGIALGTAFHEPTNNPAQ